MTGLETQRDALAEIYARSLFELAEKEGGREAIERIDSELDAVIEITRQSQPFVEFLRTRLIPASQRAQSLRRIFQDRVSDLLLRFFLVLNEKGRLDRIGTIASAYEQIMEERFGRVEVDVYTAGAIEPAQLEAIGERVMARIGREPVLHHYKDPSMIGGLRLRIGDQLVDASVSTRLRRMRERMTGDGAARIRTDADRLFED